MTFIIRPFVAVICGLVLSGCVRHDKEIIGSSETEVYEKYGQPLAANNLELSGGTLLQRYRTELSARQAELHVQDTVILKELWWDSLLWTKVVWLDSADGEWTAVGQIEWSLGYQFGH